MTDFIKMVDSILQGDASALSSLEVRIKNKRLSDNEINIVIEKSEQAIKNKNSIAFYLRGFMHYAGLGGPVDYPKAIELYDKGIQLGNASAMNNRAYMHHVGEGGPIDYPTAIELYDEAIHLGNPYAMNNRGRMHQLGQGGPIDYPKAIELYDNAILLGHDTAMCNRAYMHQFCQGGPQDYPKAIELYEKAILKGVVVAMYNLGFLYLTEGKTQNFNKSARCYRQAAENKYQNAIDYLSKKETIYAKYHAAMLQADFDAVIPLLLQDESISQEILFDINRSVNNDHLHQRLCELINHLQKNKIDVTPYRRVMNDLAIKTIIARHDQRTKNYILYDHDLLKTVFQSLEKVELADARLEDVTELIKVVVDSWHAASQMDDHPNSYATSATDYLTQLLFRLGSYSYKKVCLDSHFIRQIMMIISKHYFGEEYEVDFSLTPDIKELHLMLVAIQKNPDISFGSINQIMGRSLIKESPPHANSPHVLFAHTTEPDKIDSFATENIEKNGSKNI